MLGISQERLGALLGVTYQQVQKYERGTNRIGSSRLHDLCRILGVPVSYFFDEPCLPASGLAEAAPAFDEPPPPPVRWSGSESLELFGPSAGSAIR